MSCCTGTFPYLFLLTQLGWGVQKVILGSTMFLIFINDLHNVTSSKIFIYEDDATITSVLIASPIDTGKVKLATTLGKNLKSVG